MDTLDVLELAEERSGPERRDAMRQLLVTARELGCRYNVGGGKAGGFNVRYGSLRYAVLDANTRGEVFFHIKPHPSRAISDDDRDEANEIVQNIEGFSIKNGPINHYGQIEEDLEEVPHEAIAEFLEWAVDNIREKYYEPHMGPDQKVGT